MNSATCSDDDSFKNHILPNYNQGSVNLDKNTVQMRPHCVVMGEHDFNRRQSMFMSFSLYP